MSTVQDSQTAWTVKENVDNMRKYEKCLNITEEIYKRINLTFQIKKLETATQSDVSDHSDQIDSNELSNETDLFACDKSSLSSSSEASRAAKYVNINNNVEPPRPPPLHQHRPRKRFRKRVKKRQCKPAVESDGSSDEALPLSRIVDIDVDKCPSAGQGSPDRVMGVPNILILAKDSKPKTQSSKQSKKQQQLQEAILKREPIVLIEKKELVASKVVTKGTDDSVKEKSVDNKKSCALCSLSFRGERGLRRHMTMSHVIKAEDRTAKNERDLKPA